MRAFSVFLILLVRCSTAGSVCPNLDTIISRLETSGIVDADWSSLSRDELTRRSTAQLTEHPDHMSVNVTFDGSACSCCETYHFAGDRLVEITLTVSDRDKAALNQRSSRFIKTVGPSQVPIVDVSSNTDDLLLRDVQWDLEQGKNLHFRSQLSRVRAEEWQLHLSLRQTP